MLTLGDQLSGRWSIQLDSLNAAAERGTGGTASHNLGLSSCSIAEALSSACACGAGRRPYGHAITLQQGPRSGAGVNGSSGSGEVNRGSVAPQGAASHRCRRRRRSTAESGRFRKRASTMVRASVAELVKRPVRKAGEDAAQAECPPRRSRVAGGGRSVSSREARAGLCSTGAPAGLGDVGGEGRRVPELVSQRRRHARGQISFRSPRERRNEVAHQSRSTRTLKVHGHLVTVPTSSRAAVVGSDDPQTSGPWRAIPAIRDASAAQATTAASPPR